MDKGKEGRQQNKDEVLGSTEPQSRVGRGMTVRKSRLELKIYCKTRIRT
jgi:hypothetical protein